MLICGTATEASLCLPSLLIPEKGREVLGLYDLRWKSFL